MIGACAGALLLLGCHKAERAPGDLSPDEQRALNDAAVSLDANAMDAGSVTENQGE